MKSKENAFAEVNLQELLTKLWRHKLLFLFSLLLFGTLAFTTLKVILPTYEVQTSILIDPSGKSRMLGQSKYMESDIGLIGTEKNLFNEIGILRSYSLIEETIADLDFQVTYYAGPWYRSKEDTYGNFPFTVVLTDSVQQIYGLPFSVEILNEERFKIEVDVDKFTVTDPTTQNKHERKEDLKFSGIYRLGEMVTHSYFSFSIQPPDQAVDLNNFTDKKLSFVLNSNEGLTNQYLEKLQVNQTDIQGSILTISTRGSVIAKEKTFLRQLTQNFIDSKYEERVEIAASKETFISDQLIAVADSLRRSEKQLESFRSRTNAINLTRSGSNALDQLQNLESKRGQLALDLEYYNSLYNYVRQRDKSKNVAPSVVGIEDPLLNNSLLELRRLQEKREKLSFYSGPKSPELKLVNQQIEATAKDLEENLVGLIRTSKMKLRDSDRQVASVEGSISRLPKNEKQLLNIQRKNNLYENLYNYLNQEKAKAGIARAEDIADTKVLDPPRLVGDGPVSPQKKLIYLLAVLVGLALPLAWIIFFAHSPLKKIQSVEQLTEYSDLPMIAKITHAKTNSLLQATPQDWQFKESFRDLTAQIQFLIPDPKYNIIGITSVEAGEGKTFCVQNLAIALTQAGKKVLVIDFNLRHSALFRQQQQQVRPQLQDYLDFDGVEPEKLLHRHPRINLLDFIAVKSPEEFPHRVLSHPKLCMLLEALRLEYDYILLDSPAFGLVSDYLPISKIAHIHLMILRRNYSKLNNLKKIKQLVKSGNMQRVFLLFNDALNRPSLNGYALDKSNAPKGVKIKNTLLAKLPLGNAEK